jgi:Importin-beta N-terminal domain
VVNLEADSACALFTVVGVNPATTAAQRPDEKPPFILPLMNSDSTRHASIQDVYAAVAGAVSQNPKEMSASAARLKDLMEQPGTLDLLQQIAAQKTAPLHIRQLSIIQVKNVVSTLWRSRRLVCLVRYLPWHLSKTWFCAYQARSRRAETCYQRSLLVTAR